jgi:hypothetical protein
MTWKAVPVRMWRASGNAKVIAWRRELREAWQIRDELSLSARSRFL